MQRFFEQSECFRELLEKTPPGPDQMKDVDFLLAGGEIFALVVYAQLLLENAAIYAIEDDLLDQIFDFMVRDMSQHALQLFSHPLSNEEQMACCTRMLRRPVDDPERYQRVWQKVVMPLDGAYEMNP